MRNLGLIFFLIVAELLLQGCDPLARSTVSIKSKDQLSSLNTDTTMLEVTKVVELIAKQSGFTTTTTSDHTHKVPLNMQKKNKDGIFTCISVFSEDNMIKIDIGEFGHHKLSEDALRLQNEIDNALSQSLKDCCIIIKDNKYSGRQ